MSNTIQQLEKLLSERSSNEIVREGDFVHASVMMIFKEVQSDYSLLFIKRPESLKDPFSGHMAFPGGRMEPGDKSKLETAVRETYEEVGIDISQSARVLGTLDDVNPNNLRARRYVVTPYLSVLNEEVSVNPDANEVERAIWVPMSHLADDKNAQVRIRQRNGKEVEDYAYSYDQYLIWGMTGRILHQFLAFSGHLF